MNEDKYKYSTEDILQEMRSCDECLYLKSRGSIPGCCQYHLDKQFELKEENKQ